MKMYATLLRHQRVLIDKYCIPCGKAIENKHTDPILGQLSVCEEPDCEYRDLEKEDFCSIDGYSVTLRRLKNG